MLFIVDSSTTAGPNNATQGKRVWRDDVLRQAINLDHVVAMEEHTLLGEKCTVIVTDNNDTHIVRIPLDKLLAELNANGLICPDLSSTDSRWADRA